LHLMIALALVGLGLAGGVVVVAVERIVEAQRRVDNIQHLKQLALALHSAEGHHKHLPPVVGHYGGVHGTFFYHVMPFVEQQHIYRTREVGAYPWIVVTSGESSNRAQVLFSGGYATTNYAAN